MKEGGALAQDSQQSGPELRFLLLASGEEEIKDLFRARNGTHRRSFNLLSFEKEIFLLKPIRNICSYFFIIT